MAPTQYGSIAAEIRGWITSGELRPGDRVPSTRQIVAEWGVAMATASKVLAALREEGLVRTTPGSGTVVTGASAGWPAAGRWRGVDERELNRDRIAREAILIADAEGLTAVSMRRVSAELTVAPMSLYRHVKNREDLLHAIQNAAYAEQPLPDVPPPGWRAQLELESRVHWSCYRRHPWLSGISLITRPYPGPDLVPHSEWILRALHGLGLDRMTVYQMWLGLVTHVHGTAAGLAPEFEAQLDSGISESRWFADNAGKFTAIAATGRFPMWQEFLTRDPSRAPHPDERFEFGLQRLLDGYALLIDGE